MQEERDFVILRTYEQVWKTPFKIYSIENFKLWVPINPWELLYFLLGVGIVFFLGLIIPFFSAIPFIIRYIALPFGIMKFFSKVKLDGKMPHKFFWDYVIFFFGNKKIERFQAVKEVKKVKITKNISFRVYEPVKPQLEKVKKNKKARKEEKHQDLQLDELLAAARARAETAATKEKGGQKIDV